MEQPRENPCPCVFCKRSTWALDRVCEQCATRLERLPAHAYRSHGPIHRHGRGTTSGDAA